MTLEAIAREKLGLAEPGVPFYLDQLDDPLDALAHRFLERRGQLGAEAQD